MRSVDSTRAGPSRRHPEQVLRHLDADAAVTLLLLSTPLCTRCPQAHAVLEGLAAAARGVRHTEVDLAEHPELADLPGARSTPTTLAVARGGHELFRVTGVPRREELLSALQPHLGS
ncbi:MAG TPA: thioredoxin family protein [Pseudonocardiaceae bacterium]